MNDMEDKTVRCLKCGSPVRALMYRFMCAKALFVDGDNIRVECRGTDDVIQTAHTLTCGCLFDRPTINHALADKLTLVLGGRAAYHTELSEYDADVMRRPCYSKQDMIGMGMYVYRAHPHCVEMARESWWGQEAVSHRDGWLIPYRRILEHENNKT